MRSQNVWGETRAQMELQSIEVRRGRKKKCLFGLFLGAVLCKTVLQALFQLPSVLNQRHGAQPRLPICSTSAQFALLSEKRGGKKRGKSNIKTAVWGCGVWRRRGRGAAARGTSEVTLFEGAAYYRTDGSFLPMSTGSPADRMPVSSHRLWHPSEDKTTQRCAITSLPVFSLWGIFFFLHIFRR